MIQLRESTIRNEVLLEKGFSRIFRMTIDMFLSRDGKRQEFALLP